MPCLLTDQQIEDIADECSQESGYAAHEQEFAVLAELYGKAAIAIRQLQREKKRLELLSEGQERRIESLQDGLDAVRTDRDENHIPIAPDKDTDEPLRYTSVFDIL